MNVIICGAGEVGTHAAEVLGPDGHNITLIDQDADRIQRLEETMDVSTLRGSCARAEVLRHAGAEDADLVIATTHSDEINLLTASVGKALGARKSIARVHYSSFFEQRGLSYLDHLGIDQLVCPEFSTAQSIAQLLRNPASLAIENFAEGRIEMQDFPVSEKAPAVGKRLLDSKFPQGSRLLAIVRKGEAFIPDGETKIEPEDRVVLVGNTEIFQQARKLFHRDDTGRRHLVIMGGDSVAVWLARALLDRNISIKIFEKDREKSEQLAVKLDWVTVINADPTGDNVFQEEHIEKADAFVAATADDEHNILGSAWAKSKGVPTVIAVAERAIYLHLLKHVGIDFAISPRRVAVAEIKKVLDESPLQRIASVAEGVLDIYRIIPGEASSTFGKPLHDLKLTPDWIICAILRGRKAFVPRPTDCLEPGDIVKVIGLRGREKKLRKIFGTG